MATSTATKNTITLRGSTAIVTEFFGYSINSILYQRGIYPPESFVRVNKYGLTMLVTDDDGLKAYLGDVLAQLNDWLLGHCVQKLVLVITSVATNEVLERWTFDIEADKAVDDGATVEARPDKEVKGEIQAIIRQITASVTFLPMLEEACTFDLLVYTDNDLAVPLAWEESDPKYIANSEEVRLRSFTTQIHKVDTMVSFKA
ncbi:mitotic spindle assembly checkpoint protein MAD2A [Thecamonas trahens ATCC 50062]|uniref:Mitotic spindle assembly checkpoint protein MAD2A n=1 Tax=Thecamonas trahens ATCC 50062 TaxID=461836 RepID=A0A0L0DQY0_THETB|nr:mitotic spindle assembly checkpoint protein MAD2A [Thecamonas trahens ATCC 50062]KNC53843.1 mitotic spindle assembly checkpoint protein MAD2A [Thecamonas trahens ATCC 50062]|eukprot:XP_013754224.1 mitotic spindle assembly checkpoint protein MAD2A [Thecamonas trahens ATCC 50062]